MNYVTRPIPESKPPVSEVTRPWGSFRQYANNEEVTVSLMTVKPGMRLSLQSHTGRAELWIALDPASRSSIPSQAKNSGSRPTPSTA